MKIDLSKLFLKLDKVEKYLKNDASTTIGVEAVNHFKESFEKQGFTDTSLEKWEEVERRKPDSSWYEFKYGSRIARPGVKRRKANSVT